MVFDPISELPDDVPYVGVTNWTSLTVRGSTASPQGRP